MDVIIKESFTASIQVLEPGQQGAVKHLAFDLQLESDAQRAARLVPLLEERGYWKIKATPRTWVVVHLSEETFALCYAAAEEDILPWLKLEVLSHRPSEYQAALDVAVHAAREAGRRLRQEFHRPGGPRGDGHKEPIDREVETLIRAQIDRAFPRHGIVSEESPEENRAPEDPEGHTWLIDPNDGTSGFHQGYRGASVSIALLRDGVPVLGVIYAYAAPDGEGDLLAWAEGCGPMTRNGEVVRRRPWAATLNEGSVVMVSHLADTRALANARCVHPARYRTIPGIAYRLALVAAGEGEVGVSIAGSRPFDVAAGHALLRSQGGELVGVGGAPITYTRDGGGEVGACAGGSPELAAWLLERPWSVVLNAADCVTEPLDLTPPLQGSPAYDDGMLDRAVGALCGAVTGDALGSLVSFQTPASILRRFPSGLHELHPNTTWGTLAGQPTDTTESLLALARALVAEGGFDEEAIARAYVWWYRTRPFDMDRVTERVLEALSEVGVEERGLAALARQEAGHQADKQGNGALIRLAPLAVAGHRVGPQVVASWAVADTSLTHAHPVCRDASVVLAVAMAHAIATGRGPADVYAYAKHKAQELSLHRNVVRTLENAGTRAPRDYTHRANWVLVALQNAFHQLVFAPDVEQGVIDTVMRGGDADANAAVTGALLGSVYGHKGLPERWRRLVLTCRPLEGLDGVSRPRPRAFWPVDLTVLAERLLALGEDGQRGDGQEVQPGTRIRSSRRLKRSVVPRRPDAPFRTSPSAVARYFFLDCARFFRFKSTREADRVKQGLPGKRFDRGPLMRELVSDGYRWEEAVLERYLKGRVAIPAGSGPIHTRNFTIRDTLGLLHTEPAGRFIYQGMLRPPPEFYKAYELDPTLLEFSDNYPDLIAVMEDPKRPGGRLFRILDVKRGISLRSTYTVQILLYAMILDQIIRAEGIEDARVDMEHGGVWLGMSEEPEPCDLTSIRPHVLRFLRKDMPGILQAEVGEVPWHVYFRCEWCDYFKHCRQEMREGDDVSRVSHLTSFAKRFLVEQADVRTVGELKGFLEGDEAVEVLSQCASLSGQRHHLRSRVEALHGGEVMLYGTSSSALARPTQRDVYIYLTLQNEPLHRTTYMAGMMINANTGVPPAVLGSEEEATRPAVFVARTPEDADAVRREFVRRLYEALRRVHDYNAVRSERDQLSLQLFVHTWSERDLLVKALLESLDEPELAQAAMALLLHIQGPELMEADDHPEEPVSHPVVTLLGAVARLMALPVEVSYTLPEVMEALGCRYTYHRSSEFHFPLGHGLRADPIISAWLHGKAENVERVRKQGESLLFAIRSLMWTLRDKAMDHLFAWPPRFVFPTVEQIKDPLLSRLAFFARYESYMRCLQVRGPRLESLVAQRQNGTVIELEALDDQVMRVIAPAVELSANDFSNWILVPDTPEGHQAQLTFDDYRYRRTAWRWAPHESRAVVGLVSVLSDELGFTSHVRLLFYSEFRGQPPKRGERYLLYPRFQDFNTDRVVNFLKKLDRIGPGLFLELLRDPVAASSERLLPAEIEETAQAQEEALKLTPSKIEAYRAIRERRMMAVWGPPGTGKTHFLASVILGLASAYARHGRPFRVLVTAFTHAAIENLLARITELEQKRPELSCGLRLGKAASWYGTEHGEQVAVKEMSGWLDQGGCLVLGATVYACLKVYDEIPDFDLVVIDEASQVRVPEASIPASKVAPDGRLVLAGDHFQLAPIVVGSYPEPDEGQPVLHRSVFEAVQSMAVGDDGLVRQLLENFRMNSTLTNTAARLLYPDYTCIDEDTANQRIAIDMPEDLDPLLEACLDPEHPLVLVVLRGVVAARENPIEASLVADLVLTLREGLHAGDGHPYGDDASFFRDGVFVVSPHHSQIRLIRRELAARRVWSAAPFVDTVDKMQGQEAEAVIVSYGVSDAEFAMMEADFIYGLNRLNVSITRARAKTIVCLPQPLLDASPQVLETREAAQGLAFMRRLSELVEEHGDRLEFSLGDGVEVDVYRLSYLDQA